MSTPIGRDLRRRAYASMDGNYNDPKHRASTDVRPPSIETKREPSLSPSTQQSGIEYLSAASFNESGVCLKHAARSIHTYVLEGILFSERKIKDLTEAIRRSDSPINKLVFRNCCFGAERPPMWALQDKESEESFGKVFKCFTENFPERVTHLTLFQCDLRSGVAEQTGIRCLLTKDIHSLQLRNNFLGKAVYETISASLGKLTCIKLTGNHDHKFKSIAKAIAANDQLNTVIIRGNATAKVWLRFACALQEHLKSRHATIKTFHFPSVRQGLIHFPSVQGLITKISRSKEFADIDPLVPLQSILETRSCLRKLSLKGSCLPSRIIEQLSVYLENANLTWLDLRQNNVDTAALKSLVAAVHNQRSQSHRSFFLQNILLDDEEFNEIDEALYLSLNNCLEENKKRQKEVEEKDFAAASSPRDSHEKENKYKEDPLSPLQSSSPPPDLFLGSVTSAREKFSKDDHAFLVDRLVDWRFHLIWSDPILRPYLESLFEEAVVKRYLFEQRLTIMVHSNLAAYYKTFLSYMVGSVVGSHAIAGEIAESAKNYRTERTAKVVSTLLGFIPGGGSILKTGIEWFASLKKDAKRLKKCKAIVSRYNTIKFAEEEFLRVAILLTIARKDGLMKDLDKQKVEKATSASSPIHRADAKLSDLMKVKHILNILHIENPSTGQFQAIEDAERILRNLRRSDRVLPGIPLEDYVRTWFDIKIPTIQVLEHPQINLSVISRLPMSSTEQDLHSPGIS